MSRESKFHNLIEQQSQENKRKSWERLENCCDYITTTTGQESVIAKMNNKKFIIILAAFVFMLCSFLIIFITTLPNEQNFNRYCSNEDYNIIPTTETLKDYSETTGKEILFFDWYEQSNYYIDYIFQLKETSEIICYREYMEAIGSDNIIIISITDENTEIDIFETYKLMCDNHYKYKNIDINWGGQETCYAYFVYKDYTYYIEIDNLLQSDLILDYIKQLIG